jgi:hypothetical protein
VQLPQLNRIRWAVRAALTLGVAASVIANVLHARHNPISQAIAAWPPLALLLTVELTSRIPMHRWALAACRVLATVAIAGIAAWVSYWHMQDVATRYGETRISSYLLPISVDGLIVVASVSLVELAGRIRFIEDQRAKAAEAAAAAQAAALAPAAPAAPAVPAAAPVTGIPMSRPVPMGPVAPTFRPAPAPATQAAARITDADLAREFDGTTPRSAPVSPAVAPLPRTPASAPLSHNAPVSPAVTAATRQVPAYVNGTTPPAARSSVTRAAVSAPPRTVVTATATTAPADSTAPRPRRPVQETADLAEAIEAMHPEISDDEIARQLGISATRLRAVRREAREVSRSER